MKENDITDMALENICRIVQQLTCLERIDIEGNLFYRVRKFHETLSRLRSDPAREVVPVILHTNVHPYKLI